jgi:hypothetical protein
VASVYVTVCWYGAPTPWLLWIASRAVWFFHRLQLRNIHLCCHLCTCFVIVVFTWWQSKNSRHTCNLPAISRVVCDDCTASPLSHPQTYGSIRFQCLCCVSMCARTSIPCAADTWPPVVLIALGECPKSTGEHALLFLALLFVEANGKVFHDSEPRCAT